MVQQPTTGRLNGPLCHPHIHRQHHGHPRHPRIPHNLELHLDDRSLTLARFRAICSALKAVIYQRLPKDSAPVLRKLPPQRATTPSHSQLLVRLVIATAASLLCVGQHLLLLHSPTYKSLTTPMTTIDALAYPHILDAVLHTLHQDGQHRTLANFRQTCSAVKQVIDTCLPRRFILAGEPADSSTRQSFCLEAETRLWAPLTDSWWRSPIEQIVDVHARLDDSTPLPEWKPTGRVPVLRLFNCAGVLPPLSADTAVIFPSAAHFSPPGRKDECVWIPPDSDRTIINMRFERHLPDFRFGYDLRKPAHSGYHRFQPVMHRKQELVLMFTSCSLSDQTGRLHGWTASVVEALYANPLLTVTLLIDGWDWRWFTAEDYVEEWSWLQDEADDRERLEQAWHYHFMGAIVEMDEDEGWPAELFHGRVRLMTMEEFEAHAGMRMSALVEE